VKSPAKKSVPASQKPTPDVLVANTGTVFTFCPLTAQAGEWDERTNVGAISKHVHYRGHDDALEACEGFRLALLPPRKNEDKR